MGSLKGQHGSLKADFVEVLKREIALQQIEQLNKRCGRYYQ